MLGHERLGVACDRDRKRDPVAEQVVAHQIEQREDGLGVREDMALVVDEREVLAVIGQAPGIGTGQRHGGGQSVVRPER